jgi:plastocyanin
MAERHLRSRIFRAFGGAIVAAALAGAGTAMAADQAVSISGFSYSPASVTVNVGDTITWTNSDAQAHTATADDASWDTGTISGSGGTGAVTFSTAGAFPYHCSIHPEITGTVTVQAAAGTAAPTAGATTPPTDVLPISPPADDSIAGALAALAIVAAASAVGAIVLRWKPATNR